MSMTPISAAKWRKWDRLLLALGVVAALGAVWTMATTPGEPTAAGGPIVWITDGGQAHSMAAASGKPTLMLFTSQYCPPCEKMRRQVYTQPQVAEMIGTNFIPVKVDLTRPGESERRAATTYGIEYIPTLVVVDPRGREIARSGYQDTEGLMTLLRAALAKSIVQ